MNGWSALKSITLPGIQSHIVTTAVAAPASAPSSFTSMKARCSTSDMRSPCVPSILEKSAFPRSNPSFIPMLERVSFKREFTSILNLGSQMLACCMLISNTRRTSMRCVSVSLFSNCCRLVTLSSGRRMNMLCLKFVYGISNAEQFSSLLMPQFISTSGIYIRGILIGVSLATLKSASFVAALSKGLIQVLLK